MIRSSRLLSAVAILVAMLTAVALAEQLRPTPAAIGDKLKLDLEEAIPRAFGPWRLIDKGNLVVVDPHQLEVLNKIYSQTLSRTYANSDDYRVMLSMAYGGNQSDNMQAHKPEVCYPAQGFQVLKQFDTTLRLPEKLIPIRRLVAKQSLRVEPITYWVVVGDQVALSGWQRKLAQLRFGLTGTIPDGVLIRVSSIDNDEDRAFAFQTQFLDSLLGALEPKARTKLIGAPQ